MEVQTCQVACVGESMAAVIPGDGESLEVSKSFVVSSAGAEANVSMYLASLGVGTVWISRVGEDPLGRRILREIGSAGVDVSFVEVDSKRRTGVMFKDISHGERRVFYYREHSAASQMGAEVIKVLQALRPQVIHVTGITAGISKGCDELIHSLFAEAESFDGLVSFDVNYRGMLWKCSDLAAEKLLSLARMARIVFVGVDEAEELWDVASIESIARLLKGPEFVVIKDGGRGALEYREGRKVFVPALSVDVVDEVGAGDAFAAGWLAGYLSNYSSIDRLALGHILGARTVTSVKDYAGPPGREWIEEVIGHSAGFWSRWIQRDIARAWSGALFVGRSEMA